tara:strand:+ start:1134 stop:1859 length:726 start_codon:yes stop_codon:yes gene_type:complete
MTNKGKEVEANAEKLSRNTRGLLENPPIDYVFNKDGSVDWRKMVRKEYLVPNKQKTSETDVSLLEDRDLLILLGGIKELAQIRGFSSVSYEVVAATQEYFATSCIISWLPNYETNDESVIFSALADAHTENTYSFASNFLAATAENRAFVRCVRNFLKINIVGQEEMGNSGSSKPQRKNSPKSDSNPSTLLKKVMEEKSISFENIKNKLVQEDFPKAEVFFAVEDIPKTKTFELIGRLKKL